MIDETSLYRLYGPKDQLLYVGISLSPVDRFGSHRRRGFWPEVSRIGLEHFDTRREAEIAEALAIRDENPAYNIARPWVLTADPPEPGDETAAGRARQAALDHAHAVAHLHAAMRAMRAEGASLRDIGAVAGMAAPTVSRIVSDTAQSG